MVCHDMEVVADYATRCIVMSDGTVVDDAPTFDGLRNRDTLERASLVPPQIVDLSLELARDMSRLAETAVGRANTVDELSLIHISSSGRSAACSARSSFEGPSGPPSCASASSPRSARYCSME